VTGELRIGIRKLERLAASGEVASLAAAPGAARSTVHTIEIKSSTRKVS
jgi:hypothetical protein